MFLVVFIIMYYISLYLCFLINVITIFLVKLHSLDSAFFFKILVIFMKLTKIYIYIIMCLCICIIVCIYAT